MALELRQNLKLAQQLVMTPQLQQAIKMLQLSQMELMETINEELEQNPVLETVPDDDQDGEAYKPLVDEEVVENPLEERFKEVSVMDTAREDINWENYLGEYGSSSLPNMREIPEEFNTDNFISSKTSLADHLTWQWHMMNSTPEECRVADQIIGNLDIDGYLKAPVEEIAELENVSPELVSQVLVKVQDLDPAGVAARDLRECLLLQIKGLGLAGSLPERLAADFLPDLENKNYSKILKELKASREELSEAIAVIMHLEPRPGRAFANEDPQYIIPDVYVYKMGDEYVIVLNDEGLPRLKVNRYYREALTNQRAVSAKDKEYIQEKLRSAVWLIRSIHQRQRTICRVTESIVKFQREFMEKGINYLKPLILRDVAEDVEMHESTISRVTTNKYVHTPQGIFELKYFFNSSISRIGGEALASESVKDRIQKIIAAEDPLKPLSDQRIVEILRGSDIDIARRTVAKYREMLGILSSSKRKAPF